MKPIMFIGLTLALFAGCHERANVEPAPKSVVGSNPDAHRAIVFNEETHLNIDIVASFVDDSGQDGGGIRNSSGTVEVSHCMIQGNSAARDGGGIRNSSGILTVYNSVIGNNAANNDGGGIRSSSGTMDILCSTISGNWAGRNGGGLRKNNSGQVTIQNTVIELNEAEAASDNVYGTCSESHSWIDNGDPGFVRNPSPGLDDVWATEDDDFGDLRLTALSDLIDAGDNSLLPLTNPTPIDSAGNPRVQDGNHNGTATVDIGAYERPE